MSSKQHILKYDTEVLRKALALVDGEHTPPTIRTILANLMNIITVQDNYINTINPTKQEAVIEQLFNKKDDSINRKKANIVEVTRQVQDYLSNTHSTLVEESYSSLKKKERLKEVIKNYVTHNKLVIIEADIEYSLEESSNKIIEEITGFSILDPFLTDESTDFDDFIEEIRVDDYNDIRIVKGGKEYRTTASFKDPVHALDIAKKFIRLSTSSEKPLLTITNAFVRVRLGKTTRCSIMASPVAVRDRTFDDSPEVVHMCIRRQRPSAFTPEMLLNFGSVNEYMDILLKNGVGNGIPMIFYGGTNSGKTGTLGCYLRYLRDDTRTIAIAEIDELNLRNIDRDRLRINPKTGQKELNPFYGKAKNSAITWEINDLETAPVMNKKGFQGPVNASLTFSPETGIIQESKGPEVKDLMDMAISGHQIFTSVHADNVIILLDRILSMYSQSGTNIREDIVLRQIPYAFFWAVKMIKLADGKRKIQEITELLYYDSIKGFLYKNVLSRFEVEKNVIDESTKKLKTIGKFVNYNFPTQKSINRMQVGGLIEKDYQLMKEIFEKDHENDLEKCKEVNNSLI